MLPNKQGFRCVPSIGSFTSQACDFKSRSVASVKAVWATITFGCKKGYSNLTVDLTKCFFTLTKARAFLFKCSTSSIWSSLQGPKFHGDVLCTCQNVSTQDNHQILSSNGCVWIVVIHRRGEICSTASSREFSCIFPPASSHGLSCQSGVPWMTPSSQQHQETGAIL